MEDDFYHKLHFVIGEDSSMRELEIIPVPPYEFIQNNLSLEPYEYFGGIKDMLGFPASQIFLYYNADVLMRVKVLYRSDLTLELISEIEKAGFELPQNISLTISYDKISDETELMYQDNKLN